MCPLLSLHLLQDVQERACGRRVHACPLSGGDDLPLSVQELTPEGEAALRRLRQESPVCLKLAARASSLRPESVEGSMLKAEIPRPVRFR